MDTRLYKPGGDFPLSIPIKKAAGIWPNFFILEQQYGCHRAKQVNIQTGDLEVTDCVKVNYKLVLREILEPDETYVTEGERESILFPTETMPLPIDLLPLLATYQRIKANTQIVNLALSRFSFRGALSSLVLEVDEDVLDEILADMAAKEAALALVEQQRLAAAALAEQERLAALEAQNEPEPQPE